MTSAEGLTDGLAKVVSDAMKAHGKNQRDIAEATGIPLVTLNRRLTGRSPFVITELIAIAEVLDVSLVELVVRAERLSPRDVVA
jgi:transcriptional regulator with XRE-family HTH domain